MRSPGAWSTRSCDIETRTLRRLSLTISVEQWTLDLLLRESPVVRGEVGESEAVEAATASAVIAPFSSYVDRNPVDATVDVVRAFLLGSGRASTKEIA